MSSQSQHGSQQGRSQMGSPSRRSQAGGGPSGSRQQGAQRSGSQQGSQQGASQQGSQRGSPQSGRTRPFPPGLGFDPALEKPQMDDEDLDDEFRRTRPSRIDLPPEAFIREFDRSPFPLRPGYNTSTKEIMVRVNQFRIESLNCQAVWQYDVRVTGVSPDHPKLHTIVKKCWNARTTKQKIGSLQYKWLFDGKAMAWSLNNCGDQARIRLDLDEEYGQRSRGDGSNVFNLVITQTNKIQLVALKAYIEGNADWSDHVLECLNFFDHALRQRPSERMIAIKRNFYHENSQQEQLDKAVAASKGIYASFRIANNLKDGGTGLAINVDVANTTFWISQTMDLLVRNYLEACSPEWRDKSPWAICDLLEAERHDSNGVTGWKMSEAFRTLRRLHKLHFFIKHRGKEQDPKDYTIARFSWDPKFGKEGGSAKNVTFTIKRTGEVRTIFDHFQKMYNIRLNYPRLPVIETTRDGKFPMEVCWLKPWQRYNFKLDPAQTAKMIKFAVTRPQERGRHIMENVQKLEWGQDPYLAELGIKVSPNMTLVKARLLPNPEIQYGNGKVNPGTSGRWDLRGRIFFAPNRVPLRSWGFIVTNNCVDMPTVMNFARVFKETYKKHGGKIDKDPKFVNYSRQDSIADVVHDTYMKVGRENMETPTMFFVILPDKAAYPYYRYKKSFECRFGMVSQMLNVAHVRKAQPQYCSNVSMKVNSKLGGTTCRVMPAGGKSASFFSVSTMIIGCDVSHGSSLNKRPEDPEPSMAAMTVSMDRDGARYAATCQTNGFRREIVSPLNIKMILPRLIKKWVSMNSNTLPKHVFYMRDGVSEGQFAQVLESEMTAIKSVFADFEGPAPKMTVIIATKRHHVRFFPEKGAGGASDKNGNPLPGTLVEREVTHPYYYDFYLCSHVAIQGTARPVHYHVIHDEVGMKADELQKMIYQMSYQYARSTTPVSLHPAVYYAHLAADRARAHEDIASPSRDPEMDKKQSVFHKGKEHGGVVVTKTESKPLLDFGTEQADKRNIDHITYTMWYI